MKSCCTHNLCTKNGTCIRFCSTKQSEMLRSPPFVTNFIPDLYDCLFISKETLFIPHGFVFGLGVWHFGGPPMLVSMCRSLRTALWLNTSQPATKVYR